MRSDFWQVIANIARTRDVLYINVQGSERRWSARLRREGAEQPRARRNDVCLGLARKRRITPARPRHAEDKLAEARDGDVDLEQR